MLQNQSDNHSASGIKLEGESTAAGSNTSFAEVEWLPQARQESPPPAQRGSWLIFADSHGLGQTLATLLEAQGECCILVFPGQSYQSLRGEQWYWLNPARLQDVVRLFGEVETNGQPSDKAIIYLWGVEELYPYEMGSADSEEGQAPAATTLVYLIRTLEESRWRDKPRLWVVTRGTQRIAAEEVADPSALWRVAWPFVQQAHYNFGGALVDLDPATPTDEAALLFEELWCSQGNGQIAFRQGQRYVSYQGNSMVYAERN